MGAVPLCAARTVIGLKRLLAKNAAHKQLLFQKPPQLDPQASIEDTVVMDWRWLALRCERRLVSQSKRRGPSRRVAEFLGENFDIDQFACFVPRTVLEAIADSRIRYSEDFDIIIENFNAAVVFCDASGFTALTEALDKQPNGAEKLGECINNFFTPLIQIVSYWGGDIIKFSGDALTIVWPVDDEPLPGEDAARPEAAKHYKIDSFQACRLACQCCLELHSNLNHFPTPIEGKEFTLHIGVGYGRVGGTLDRWEYVVAGVPMQEISIGEPLAGSGETVISASVIQILEGQEGASLEFIDIEGSELPYAKMFGLIGPRAQPPPPLESIELNDTDVELLKRFIPPAVFKRLTAGYNVFINELRRISVIFVGVEGLDVSSDKGSQAAHRLMQLTQKAAYTMEGAVNKFLVDDKGVLVLLMFGLPPVYHLDDPLRALLAALRIVDGLKSLGLTAGIGVATGRVWCGTVGCELRKEYTALGDTVNLAARLMGKAHGNEINCDVETMSLCDHVMEFRSLPPVQMKGKLHLVPIYQPTGRMKRQAVLQTSVGEPINTWQGWKYKRRLYRLFYPGYEYRNPIINIDCPLLDYPVQCGPLFPWEYIEPWMPSLMPWIDLGGVAIILGKETEGTQELVEYISQLSKSLGRTTFLCSNMPDSAYVNISNVPLLAWRKLCTEMVTQWRRSPARELKGYSKVDRDNSLFGLARELIHPIFHWYNFHLKKSMFVRRLTEMKSVIHGLVLPYEVPENKLLDKEILKRAIENESVENTHHRLRTAFQRISHFTAALVGHPIKINELYEENQNDNISASRYLGEALLNIDEDRSLAPMISSLVNGYTMYDPSIVCLHVRSGTSLFASMDAESWKVARLIGRMAMLRRRRKMELDMKDLKKWRRRHSRDCLWCRNVATPFRKLEGKMYPKWTSRCRPPPSRYFPPFLFIVVCSEVTSHVPEQQELISWAKECNCLIQMRRLPPTETRSYLGHCLSVPDAMIPDELAEVVHRISAGIPKYIFLTAKQLMTEQAVVIERLDNDTAKLFHQETLKREKLRQRHLIGSDQSLFQNNKLMIGEIVVRPSILPETDTLQALPPSLQKSSTSIECNVKTEEHENEIVKKEEEDESKEREERMPSQVTVYDFEQRLGVALKSAFQSERQPSLAVAPVKKKLKNILMEDIKIVDHFSLKPREQFDQIGHYYYASSNNEKIYIDRIAQEKAFLTTFQRITDHQLRYAREKYEKPICDAYAVDSTKDDTIYEPDWESSTRHTNLNENKGQVVVRLPFMPPGPEVFTSRVGRLAFRGVDKPPLYDTSRVAQLTGNTREKHGETSHSFGALTHRENTASEKYPFRRIRIIKDLKKVPFVPELQAAAMSLMERLEPDEQLAAKVASVFPVPFTGLELQAVFPQNIDVGRFQNILSRLTEKAMLERCCEASEELLNELDLIPFSRTTVDYNVQRRNDSNDDENYTVSKNIMNDVNINVWEQPVLLSTPSLEPEADPIVANRFGFDEDGNPIFHQFTSIAFQHVVADLLMSQERRFLARIARKVICFRRTYGFNFLMKQVQDKTMSQYIHQPKE